MCSDMYSINVFYWYVQHKVSVFFDIDQLDIPIQGTCIVLVPKSMPKHFIYNKVLLCYSHIVANILANMTIWNSRQIRRKWYDWPGEILNKIRPYKWLRMLANVLRMPLRMLRMVTIALRMKRLHNANVWQTAYTHLDNVTKHGRVSNVTWTCSQTG
jgi:hypothetical protein